MSAKTHLLVGSLLETNLKRLSGLVMFFRSGYEQPLRFVFFAILHMLVCLPHHSFNFQKSRNKDEVILTVFKGDSIADDTGQDVLLKFR